MMRINVNNFKIISVFIMHLLLLFFALITGAHFFISERGIKNREGLFISADRSITERSAL